VLVTERKGLPHPPQKDPTFVSFHFVMCTEIFSLVFYYDPRVFVYINNQG